MRKLMIVITMVLLGNSEEVSETKGKIKVNQERNLKQEELTTEMRSLFL